MQLQRGLPAEASNQSKLQEPVKGKPPPPGRPSRSLAPPAKTAMQRGSSKSSRSVTPAGRKAPPSVMDHEAYLEKMRKLRLAKAGPKAPPPGGVLAPAPLSGQPKAPPPGSVLAPAPLPTRPKAPPPVYVEAPPPPTDTITLQFVPPAQHGVVAPSPIGLDVPIPPPTEHEVSPQTVVDLSAVALPTGPVCTTDALGPNIVVSRVWDDDEDWTTAVAGTTGAQMEAARRLQVAAAAAPVPAEEQGAVPLPLFHVLPDSATLLPTLPEPEVGIRPTLTSGCSSALPLGAQTLHLKRPRRSKTATRPAGPA